MDDQPVEPLQPLQVQAPRIAFIGGGNMAGALIGGLLRGGHAPAAISVVEPLEAQRAQLQRVHGVQVLARADATLRGCATIVWAVKPQVFADAAAACHGHIAGALQISVMAGVRSDAIAAAAQTDAVVRAMPNTPALIGRGIAGLFARAGVSAEQRAAAAALFAPTGALLWVDDEALLDAVTAVSGSGPAYVFYMLEALIDAGTALGLSPNQSRQLALATFDGATALAQTSPVPPAALRAQVTSPGGTTQAAISVLDARGVHAAFVEAVVAAARRANALGVAQGAAAAG